MSLYAVQKILYDINRDTSIQQSYWNDVERLLGQYNLTEEEMVALTKPDIGLLYVIGVNGQILMHFAALHKIAWDDYLQLMRDGVTAHGAVRDGIYAMTGGGQSFTESTTIK